MENLTRYRFRIVITDSTGITITEGAEVGTEWNKMQAITVTTYTDNQRTQYQQIAIEGQSWRNAGDGWVEQPYLGGDDRMFDVTLVEFLRGDLWGIRVAEDLGDTTMAGRSTHHLRITSANSTDTSSITELWIDSMTDYVARLHIGSPPPESRAFEVQLWQFNDSSIAIEEPPVPTGSATPLTLRPGGQQSDLDLTSISMISPDEGWAVGRQGVRSVILHYNKGHWTQAPAPTYMSLQGVCMISAAEGWAVGGNMRILHYRHGQWERVDSQARQTDPEGILNYVTMTSQQQGWAVGTNGHTLHYTGSTWTEVPSATKASLYGISMVSPDEGWAVGEESLGSMIGIVLHYKGDKWTRDHTVFTYALRSISMISPDEGWAVGVQGTILHYTSGRWIHTDSAEGAWLSGINMVSRDEGWITTKGDFLHYRESQWTPVTNPARAGLTSISMVSATEGWAVGEKGMILHYHNGVWSNY
jgi:photosystem II stability/assembly factor-like uncharacterized protein